MNKDVLQFILLFLSSVSIWCFAGIKYKRLGFMVGLCSQPFWVYATYESGQWGMLLLSFWYIFNHIRGLYNYRK